MTKEERNLDVRILEAARKYRTLNQQSKDNPSLESIEASTIAGAELLAIVRGDERYVLGGGR